MSVGGHQLALPGPGNERAVTSLKGSELKKRRSAWKKKERTAVRFKKKKPNLLAQPSLTMPNFGSVRFDGRRYCVRARRSRLTPSIVRQDFLPGCRFSVATTVSAAKGKPKKRASLQENGTGRWPPFPLTLPGQCVTRRKSAENAWTTRHCWRRTPRHYGASPGSDAALTRP